MTIEEIQVKYYYIRKSKVIVKHLEIGTNKKISEDEIINGHQGDNYDTNSKNINGFNLVASKLPKNKSGKMIQNDITVIYYYEAKDNSAMANPIIPNNNSITSSANNSTPNENLKPSSDVKTGDSTPVIVSNIIALVIILNIIQLKIQNKGRKRRSRGKRYIK